MILFVSLLKFLFFTLFFLYIPSKIIFSFIKLKAEDLVVEEGLAIVFGMVFITLVSLFIRYFGISYAALWSILFFEVLVYLPGIIKMIGRPGILKLFISRIKKDIKLPFKHLIILPVLLTGIIAQNLVLFRGGWKVPGGFISPSIHDTMWNIALSAELFHHFPAVNPAISGVLLKNNHYFYPFFLGVIRYITGIGIFDLYYRFGPILVSLLFGLGLYAVSTIYTKNIQFRALTVFLGYFSGNFAYILPFLRGLNFDWKGNTFFADQPFDQLINPYSVFGFTLMLFGIYCVFKIVNSSPKISWGYTIAGSLLFGSLYAFKSFGGVVVILALSLTAVITIVFYRKLFFLPIAVFSNILFLILFFFTTDPGKASLIWAPGWLLTQLMTDKDKLNMPKFADLEFFYNSTGNILGLLKVKTAELAVYLTGNLGSRILGFFYLLYVLIRQILTGNKKDIFTTYLITLIISISLTIPLVFNLRNSTFNIIQFTPYALVLLAVFSMTAVEKIYYSTREKRIRILGIIFVVFFIAISIPVNVKNALDKLEGPKDKISDAEMEALKFLDEKTDPNDLILIDPKQFSQDPIYIPAISERRVYLASQGYAVQTGINPDDRIKSVDEFFRNGSQDFLAENKIAYIYFISPNFLHTQIQLLSRINVKPVFENSQVIIWKVI